MQQNGIEPPIFTISSRNAGFYTPSGLNTSIKLRFYDFEALEKEHWDAILQGIEVL